MIHTAESYYSRFVQSEWNDVSGSLEESILSAIKNAQIEAIKECAEIAECCHSDSQQKYVVDKQSILKLLDQIK